YTDYGLLTSDEVICADVHKVFQQLTGMGKAITPKRLYHAPFTLRKVLIKWIDQEAVAARDGKPARIIAKMNGLTDPKVIRALYRASQAGVIIDLIVRGMCCLRPGVTGVSETIRVVSIVGRFLEHTRASYFENSTPQVYCSSADWMERNLSKRVEVCFPIMKAKLANRIKGELEAYLADSCQSWVLNSDGRYTKVSPGTYGAIESGDEKVRHETEAHGTEQGAEPCRSAQQALLDKLSITPQTPSETSPTKI
ncbi:MAG: hypothetical protein GXP10_03065, partial [Gammaproteobacteria bacterium]|nr:hypothetical protein [Gammaproteobacteria bacterium]